MKSKFTKFAAIFLVGISSCVAQDKEPNGTKWQRIDTIRISGSEALFYPMREISNNFMKNDLKTHIKMEATGSTTGILDLIYKNCDIAMSTRKLTLQEKSELDSLKIKIKEFKIAKEVVVLVTNTKNPVFQLDKNQLAGIFSGNITNWDSVGGIKERIKVFIRPNNTGCYQGFKDMIMHEKGLDYSDNALSCKSNYEVKTSLLKYPFGISFLGFGALMQNTNKGLKPLKIKNEQGTYVSPTKENIVNGKYTLVRDCYIYFDESNSERFNRLIEHIKSNDSKVILQDSGFLFLNTF
jgi:phosphate transport system substrate-binding protein